MGPSGLWSISKTLWTKSSQALLHVAMDGGYVDQCKKMHEGFDSPAAAWEIIKTRTVSRNSFLEACISTGRPCLFDEGLLTSNWGAYKEIKIGKKKETRWS